MAMQDSFDEARKYAISELLAVIVLGQYPDGTPIPITSGGEQVKVDAAATADYIGAASNDGVLRTSAPLTYADGGDFITLGVDQTAIDHTQLQNIGTNTHAQIDTHIASTSNPHSVTAAQAGAVALTGNESVDGVKTFTSFPVTPSSAPTTDYQVANKKYVDDNIGGAFSTTSNVTSNSPGALGTDDFVFGSNQLNDDADVSHYARFLFDKSSGAFRAGVAQSTQWDTRGNYSVAFGFNCTSTAAASFASGSSCTSTAAASFASGNGTDATGDYSTAMGDNCAASDNSCVAIGRQENATGPLSVAIGDANTSSGTSTHCYGTSNVSTAQGAMAFGEDANGSLYKSLHYSSGAFLSDGDSQRIETLLRAAYTTGSAAQIYIDAQSTSGRLVIPSDTAWLFTIETVGISIAGTYPGEVVAYKQSGCIKNDGGTTSLVGSISSDFSAEDTNLAAGSEPTITADDTNDQLRVQVNGLASETMHWTSSVRLIQVQ